MLTRQLMILVVASLSALSAYAQVSYEADVAKVTLEGFANVTAGWRSRGRDCGDCEEGVSFDGALRALAVHSFADDSRAGARLVLQSSSSESFEIGEATLIYFNDLGRFEVGDRMGLPDVLLGYAPNNFTFTGAEYGPASGRSLDPGGGLVTTFLDSALAAQLGSLSGLGLAASLAEDQSAKLIFVPQKRNGFLGGLSLAPNATDPRFGALAQAGLTREWYWAQNVLRVGGSYSYASADANDMEDLHSANLGITATLDDSLMLGVAVTYNGSSGTSHRGPFGVSAAVGLTASVNYNTGPWTLGGFVQAAQAEGDVELRGNDRLRALEAGVSYRLDTRVRIFAAVYLFEFDDEGGAGSRHRQDGAVWMMGTRVTL